MLRAAKWTSLATRPSYAWRAECLESDAQGARSANRRRVQRERPKSEWVVLQAAHLQIVSDDLWGAVERRLATVRASFEAGTSPGFVAVLFRRNTCYPAF